MAKNLNDKLKNPCETIYYINILIPGLNVFKNVIEY